MFDIGAALNACGYDRGLDESEPVRKTFAMRSTPLPRPRPRRATTVTSSASSSISIARRPVAQSRPVRLARAYLTPPPQLTPSVEEQDLPPDANSVELILPLVRRFAADIDLHQIWAENRTAYDRSWQRGVAELDGGRIVFKGKDITRMLPSHRVRVGLGLTFQTNRVFGNLSVRQNLEIPLATIRSERGVGAEDRYRMALDRFDLDRHDETQAANIPHHKRQWLEIAMVLAGGPDLLLLDEPTAGMALEETGDTAAVLRDLNSTGLTILVVEHDMAFVREIAHRVTVLHQGRVFADGTIDEVTERQDVRDIYLGRR